jgi:hypothetical protein
MVLAGGGTDETWMEFESRYVLKAHYTRTSRLSTQTVTQRHGIGFVPLLHSHVQRRLQHTAKELFSLDHNRNSRIVVTNTILHSLVQLRISCKNYLPAIVTLRCTSYRKDDIEDCQSGREGVP